MNLNQNQREWVLFLLCLGLGVLAEISFLHGPVGISYLVFITGFYIVVFLRFRLSFNHRRIGLLFTAAIWILSGSYLFYDHTLFYHLNLLVIPILVFSHVVLITSPNTFKWSTPHFLTMLKKKFISAIEYSSTFCKNTVTKVFNQMNEQTSRVIKRVFIGIVLGFPLLLIIIGLLMSADTYFKETLLKLTQFLLRLNFVEGTLRFTFIMVFSLIFFGVLQVLVKNNKSNLHDNNLFRNKTWDSITVITILILINGIYLLFILIQFKYFFSSQLVEGYTYAEYARRGFFELIVVILINWTLLISFLKLVKKQGKIVKTTLNILYSLLIVMSFIMLVSAYQRLSMYEAAYGYTVARMLAHAFMIFLVIIFAYTFIHVWIEKISLLHFYLIIGLIFYVILNTMNIEQMVVDKNIERYNQTEKIDIYYLDSLSYTGLDGLITLYQMGEDDPDLLKILHNRKEWIEQSHQESWQSFNFIKQNVTKKLKSLNIDLVD